MHIVDASLGILGANGLVAGGIALAAGSALASKYKGEDAVTVAFFGDGATNQGVFHAAVNMADTWKLPVINLMENNHCGVSTEIHRITNIDTLAVRAKAYDISGVTSDGTECGGGAPRRHGSGGARARAGEGPYDRGDAGLSLPGPLLRRSRGLPSQGVGP